jgi:conserved hypothetical protein TIGR03440
MIAQPAPQALLTRWRTVRAATETLAAPLSAEDCQLQSMPDASPVKWHLAHTSWFFETFLLLAHAPGYRPFDAAFGYLYNSYYNGIGAQFPRAQRGLVSRPSLERVLDYRAQVDAAMTELIAARGDDPALASLVELGCHHEQQHQELILTDIKHALSLNPMQPAYRSLPSATPTVDDERALAWVEFAGGRQVIGAADDGGFAFDNEFPRHALLLRPYALADRPVSNAEFRAFIDDGGYRDPRLWLSDGWAEAQRAGWKRPLYWAEDGHSAFTLGGERALDPAAPVCHLSYYEADAYARWVQARLPTEAEWEVAAATLPQQAHLINDGHLEPQAAKAGGKGLAQMFGEVWEWTASPYVAYPGYRTPAGAVGEYNGKFMCNQFVLRGGSCATPAGHVRASYRNFFPPAARWQFAGLRLARDL